MSHRRLLSERAMLLDEAKRSGPKGKRLYRQDERRIARENRAFKKKVMRLRA